MITARSAAWRKRADIARPIVADQRLEDMRRQLTLRLVVFARVEAQIMVEQDRNVLAPFAQRRQLDLDRVEPEQQVLAEALLVGERVGRYVGGGDHPHVDRNRLVRPDRHHLALLERGQQLGLEVKRQIADLVEEQGAVVGGLEAADAVARRRR